VALALLDTMKPNNSQSMVLLNGGEQAKNLHELYLALHLACQHVTCTQWSWDPRGCTWALCSLGKEWTTTLNCYAQIPWLSLQVAGAFRIWLVAWIVDCFKFSMGHGQTPCQCDCVVFSAVWSELKRIINISVDLHHLSDITNLWDHDKKN
jgi:hypothetical protein